MDVNTGLRIAYNNQKEFDTYDEQKKLNWASFPRSILNLLFIGILYLFLNLIEL